MKNKIFVGCLLAASAFTFQSCSDFLDEDPKGQLTPGNFFSSQSDIDQSLYALYEQVNHTQNYTNPGYPQWQGDDITANPGSNKQACAEMDKFGISDNNKGVRDAWRLHYNLIKAANLIIDGAEKAPVAKENIDIAIGQARFWRAYAYYYLVRIFGPLPVNLHNVNDNGKTGLTDVKGIYDLILNDLEAVDKLNLPSSYKTEPAHLFGVDVYVTQQAVKSTLAAVYMSMAGYPLNLGQAYYAKAAAKAKEVLDGVNSGKYDAKMETTTTRRQSWVSTSRRPRTGRPTPNFQAAVSLKASEVGATPGEKSSSGRIFPTDRESVRSTTRKSVWLTGAL